MLYGTIAQKNKYDLKILDDYVDRGLLRRAENEDLVQYNYTEMVNNHPEGLLWDEITTFNRGNIYEKKTGLLIAKAMPKFMNFGQYSEQEQNQFLNENNFTVTEKMDGCLGILYKYKGKIMCNSRGSFDSYVTDKIKELLPKYKLLNTLLNYQCMNVEVISPETKIIVDYGDEENLYLITGYLNKDWSEYTKENLDMISKVTYIPRVSEVNMSWEELLSWAKTANYEKEGFVVKFDNGQRVKIKSEDYLRIAKFKCKLTKHMIWKLWKNDIYQGTDSVGEYMKDVPDELYKIAENYLEEVGINLFNLTQKALQLHEDTKHIPQKELAQYMKDHPNELNSCLFSIRNGKPVDKYLIKLVEPEQGFNVEDLNG